jgi:hypothetical protein
MTCPRCKKAYADGKPDDFASEPECAFKNEVFDPSNWQCQTMNDFDARISDKSLLLRAVDFLDGPGHDASGTITYTGGPNKGETHPTQEAEMLAREFIENREEIAHKCMHDLGLGDTP